MFTHLHVHTEYSFLDGYCHIDKLVARAKELGMNALAITDHNHLGGIYAFQQACKKVGIKPILGYEAYQTWNTDILSLPVEERWKDAAEKACKAGAITKKERDGLVSGAKGIKGIKDIKERTKPFMYDTKQYHVILLAKNQTGINNLIKLQSESAAKCTYNGRFLVDFKMLEKYKEGIICCSACVANMAAQATWKGKVELAERIILKYREIFGDDFYLELQDNQIDIQNHVNNFYIGMHEKHGIPLTASSDVHYIYKEDHKDHDVLVAIGTGTTIYNKDRMTYDNNFWLKSEEEMKAGFQKMVDKYNQQDLMKYYVEAMKNTERIAERVEEVTLGSSVPLMPKIPGVEGDTNLVLRKMAFDGLYKMAAKYKHIKDNLKKYEERLAYELNIINYKGFADYMLIVQEYLNWADDNGIMTGAGRGCSKAGTKVLMWNGSVKSIEDVVIGDSVVSHTGKIRKVLNSFVYDIEEPMTKIKCGSNDEMEYTNDHKFLAIKQHECYYYANNKKHRRYCNCSCKKENCKYRVGDNKPQWIEVSKLNTGDIVLYPKPKMSDVALASFRLSEYGEHEVISDGLIKVKRSPNTCKDRIELTPDFYRLIGYLVSNGWATSDKYYRVACSFLECQEAEATDFVNLMKDIFGIDVHISSKGGGNSKNCVINNKLIANCIRDLIYKDNAKTLNWKLINASKSRLIQLIVGMFTGNCYLPNEIDSDTKINYSSTSYNLISQLKMIFAYLGINTYITRRTHKDASWNDEFKLEISKSYIGKFVELFGKYLNVHINSNYNCNENLILEDENYFYHVVRSIEQTEVQVTKVYDFEVEEDHSYIGNNTVVHNSAAGSLVLYCIGITKQIDPIVNDLLFGRFLTIDRTGLPDIDCDISYTGRDRVIQHLKDTYQDSNVAHIGTYSQMGVKSGLKDVGRALNIKFDVMNNLTKALTDIDGFVPPTPKFKDYDLLKDSANPTEQSAWQTFNKLEEANKEVFRLARLFEGLKRNFGVHASGILVMPCNVVDYFPTRKDSKSGVTITLFTGVECEELGTAKLDVLGLKNLSIIEQTLDYLGKDINWLYDSVDINDKAIYRDIAKSKTDCVFQLESDMFKDMMRYLKPTCFNDIVAATSLGRPGPLSVGMPQDYAARKNGKEEVTYPLHGIENILGNTYGVIAYQEQL